MSEQEALAELEPLYIKQCRLILAMQLREAQMMAALAEGWEA
jgi:hypothetical protein